MIGSSFENALAGGFMIGLSVSLLMLTVGKICGLSGIFSSLMTKPREHWRWLFLVGFVLGSIVAVLWIPHTVHESINTLSIPMSIVAGLLVGFGTKISGGCTSGHGICGVSRLSIRSIVATIIFMATAMIVVFIRRNI